jgi:hypothetical protein
MLKRVTLKKSPSSAVRFSPAQSSPRVWGRSVAGSVGGALPAADRALGTGEASVSGRLLLGADVREEDQSATLARWDGWWLVVQVDPCWERVPAARCECARRTPVRWHNQVYAEVLFRQCPSPGADHWVLSPEPFLEDVAQSGGGLLVQSQYAAVRDMWVEHDGSVFFDHEQVCE